MKLHFRMQFTEQKDEKHVEKVSFTGCSKMPRCKAPETLSREASGTCSGSPKGSERVPGILNGEG